MIPNIHPANHNHPKNDHYQNHHSGSGHPALHLTTQYRGHQPY